MPKVKCRLCEEVILKKAICVECYSKLTEYARYLSDEQRDKRIRHIGKRPGRR